MSELTVRELIEQLQQHPPDNKVRVGLRHSWPAVKLVDPCQTINDEGDICLLELEEDWVRREWGRP
jgi:hypothetical protein